MYFENVWWKTVVISRILFIVVDGVQYSVCCHVTELGGTRQHGPG